MIMFHCERARCDTIESHLARRMKLRVVSEWPDVRRMASMVDCAVLVWPLLGWDHYVARLAELKGGWPELPIVLVTRRDADNVRQASNVALEEIVWYNDLDGDSTVLRAIGRARERSFLRVLASEMDDESMTPLLRRAMDVLLRAESPVGSVSGLARAVGCDRRTLWRQWRTTVGKECPLDLKDLIGWVRLVKAEGIRDATGSWERTADALNVSRTTLFRTAERLTGSGLDALASIEPAEFRDLFVQHLEGTPLQPS